MNTPEQEELKKEFEKMFLPILEELVQKNHEYYTNDKHKALIELAVNIKLHLFSNSKTATGEDVKIIDKCLTELLEK